MWKKDLGGCNRFKDFFLRFPISSEKLWNQQIVELKIKKEQGNETEVEGMEGQGENNQTGKMFGGSPAGICFC